MTMSPRRRLWSWLALLALLVLTLIFALRTPSRRTAPGWFVFNPEAQAQLPPGAAAAIRGALGEDGIRRLGQVITPDNRPSTESGGTHLCSGFAGGKPYGLAFDIEIVDDATADADTRALRLEGVVAWHRGPRAPGGPAGNGLHIHCVWPGAPTRNRQNTEQISSFVHGYRGLADAGRPRSAWADPSIRADEVAAVKRVYEHVHGEGSLIGVRTYDERHFGRSLAHRNAEQKRPA